MVPNGAGFSLAKNPADDFLLETALSELMTAAAATPLLSS
jgi:hypothetical protein